jgi:tRNA U34 5-methylaminomethyl-2-thiouridine-forming methyltransferase MnmC
MFTPPTDLLPLLTGDGSFTLESRTLGERYHSVHGAAAESSHVYIDMGFRAKGPGDLDLLEVGLGTGLNALLTLIGSERTGQVVRYHALEPWPVSVETVTALDHPGALGRSDLRTHFERMMGTDEMQVTDGFAFQRLPLPVQELTSCAAFDLVYFDAFAPTVQPEMWTLDVFQRIYRSMRPAAVLVTYCAKGVVRRTLQEAGFSVERLKGPPGKLEMLRATRPE